MAVCSSGNTLYGYHFHFMGRSFYANRCVAIQYAIYYWHHDIQPAPGRSIVFFLYPLRLHFYVFCADSLCKKRSSVSPPGINFQCFNLHYVDRGYFFHGPVIYVSHIFPDGSLPCFPDAETQAPLHGPLLFRIYFYSHPVFHCKWNSHRITYR